MPEVSGQGAPLLWDIDSRRVIISESGDVADCTCSHVIGWVDVSALTSASCMPASIPSASKVEACMLSYHYSLQT